MVVALAQGSTASGPAARHISQSFGENHGGRTGTTRNRFLWYFGNGWTQREGDPESDMTPYLKTPEDTDLREIHESWWSVP
ncbi:hypothetical protein TOPH_06123 [Tolypocladium ophioglossoides CBS 100239]|uniref:Uncharacterized protein n=1 Tax=Tolypocladium ophioglossoides (strain CBS 100239) TaxID=1163406 RepID=A0A0L0N4V8_TOLOC|nr:hypothetical protein TOPH_06123 [Tolypocladium ophioglossoides CBS 100239]